MNKIILFALMFLVNTAYAGVSSGLHSRMLVLSQSSTWDGASVITNMKAAMVKPIVKNGIITQDIDGSMVSSATTAIGALPNKDYYTTAGATGIFQENCLANGITIAACSIPASPETNLTDAQILYSAKNALNGASLSFKNSVVSFMRANGIDNSWIEYTQQVKTTSPVGLKTKYISFIITIDGSGSMNFPDPIIIDVSPTILFATYTPLKVANGLPAGWAYPNGGKIAYELRDTLFNLIAGTQKTVNVKGAYDEPVVVAGAPFDPDAGLKCLHLNVTGGVSGCAAKIALGTTDIATLTNQTGSTFAIVDYIRKVQPVYDRNPVTGVQTARTSIDVTSRTLTWNGCASKIDFNSKASIGFTLAINIDRSKGSSTGLWSPINKFATTSLSAPMMYNDTIQIPVATANASAMATTMIEPYSKKLIDKAIFTSATWIGFASLTNSGNTSTILASWNDGLSGGKTAEVGCDLSTNPVEIKYKFENWPSNYYGTTGIASAGYRGCVTSSHCNWHPNPGWGGGYSYPNWTDPAPPNFVTGVAGGYWGFFEESGSSPLVSDARQVWYDGAKQITFVAHIVYGGNGNYCHTGATIVTFVRGLGKFGTDKIVYSCPGLASSSVATAIYNTAFTGTGAYIGPAILKMVKMRFAYYCKSGHLIGTSCYADLTMYCPSTNPGITATNRCNEDPTPQLILSW